MSMIFDGKEKGHKQHRGSLLDDFRESKHHKYDLSNHLELTGAIGHACSL